MPMPSFIAESRQAQEQLRRMLFMQKITSMAAPEAVSIGNEVLGRFLNRPGINEVLVAAMRRYCILLLEQRIVLPEGGYEPHALYFRTFMVDQLQVIRPFIRNDTRPTPGEWLNKVDHG